MKNQPESVWKPQPVCWSSNIQFCFSAKLLSGYHETGFSDVKTHHDAFGADVACYSVFAVDSQDVSPEHLIKARAARTDKNRAWKTPLPDFLILQLCARSVLVKEGQWGAEQCFKMLQNPSTAMVRWQLQGTSSSPGRKTIFRNMAERDGLLPSEALQLAGGWRPSCRIMFRRNNIWTGWSIITMCYIM